MTDAVKGSHPIGDFIAGVVGDAPDGSSTARIAGDIAGAMLPGLGEAKAFKDLYAGLRNRDFAKITGGLIQLIPVAGAAGRSSLKASEKIAGEVAEKGISATTARLWNASSHAISQQLSDPATRKKLEKAAVDAGQMALTRLVGQLATMADNGQSPDVVTNEHGTFVDARKAAEAGMGGKPDKSWFDMYLEGDEGGRQVVGRHQLGTDQESRRGMRLFGPEGDDPTTRIMWWNNPDQGEPKFGIESAPTSVEEFDAIMRAYDNRSRSFRR